MKPKVLLTHSYFYRFDPKQWKSRRPYPPLGTLYAAALLRQKGYEVSLFDTCLAESPGEIIPEIERLNPDVLVIYDDGFNYLTKMCLTTMREAAFDLVQIGKNNQLTVIVSSSDSTDHYAEYLEKGADFILLGEGEITLLELVNNFSGESFDPAPIQGLAYKKEKKAVKNPLRPVIADLDTLPFPAWDLIEMESYRNIWMKHHGHFSLNIATTRGCPYHCNWCAKPIYGYKYNSRSPENVIEEISLLMHQYRATDFWICDDIFGLKVGWTRRFRELTEIKGLKFRYTIQSRADLIIKEGMADDLAASGADIVWLGAESGSQKILDAMDKGQTVEQIAQARKMLGERGIKTGLFLQFGYLGEDWHDIKMTIRMLMDLMPEDVGISISYPLPGTIFHEKVKEQLKEKANWTDSDDLAMMYKGTYPPGFYRRLHRYVHHIFRRKQKWQKLASVLRGERKPDASLPRDIIALVYYIPAIIYDKILLSHLRRK
jgi:anaerobic magnesium-protoporphyrin IX monomethyl ester cyclase